MGALSSLKNVMSMRGRLQLANALLISRLAYLICIWGNTAGSLVKKAQVVQNMSDRFVTGRNKLTRQTDLMRDCNWLDVAKMCTYYSIMQFWKNTQLEETRLFVEKKTTGGRK